MKIVNNYICVDVELDIEYEELGKHIDIVNDMIKEGYIFYRRCSLSNGNINMSLTEFSYKEYLKRMSKPYSDSIYKKEK